ncbi:MAG: hypothetical protein E7L17_11925 [Clostridium sp.]|nr:hypothetical protein [Clostridium sp.]MDU7338811.1 hypothetical protein [Clostridium sp.]
MFLAKSGAASCATSREALIDAVKSPCVYQNCQAEADENASASA